MYLKHVALASRSEEKSDSFYADLLGLTKSEPKALPLDLSKAIFNVDSELVMFNYQDEQIHKPLWERLPAAINGELRRIVSRLEAASTIKTKSIPQA